MRNLKTTDPVQKMYTEAFKPGGAVATAVTTLEPTKHEKFLKICGDRVSAALKRIELIGNCSSQAMYEYSPEEVEKIFSSLHEMVRKTEEKFQPKTKGDFSKNFFGKE